MSYPYEPSNFRSNVELSAYYFQEDTLWQSDGYSVLSNMIEEIAYLPDHASILGSYAESVGNAVPLSWDANMLRLVQRTLVALRAEPSWLIAVQADIDNATVGIQTVQSVLWIGNVQRGRVVDQNGRFVRDSFGGETPAIIRIPQNSVLPTFGMTIQPGPQGPVRPVRSIVPVAQQPPAMQPAVRAGVGSSVVALAFVGAIALAGIMLISNVRTVEQKRRRNPTKKRSKKSMRSGAYS